jgi:hypothetical protein
LSLCLSTCARSTPRRPQNDQSLCRCKTRPPRCQLSPDQGRGLLFSIRFKFLHSIRIVNMEARDIMYTYLIAIIVVTSAAVGLQCFSRGHYTRVFGADDWAMVVAYVR